MSYIYGVFLPGEPARWGMCHNKQTAIKSAKLHGGYVVRNRYEPPSREDRRAGLVTGWDAPTFDAAGELIYGNRKER